MDAVTSAENYEPEVEAAAPAHPAGSVPDELEIQTGYNLSSTTSMEAAAEQAKNRQMMLLWQYKENRSISTNWHYVFMAAYIFIGLTAVLANSLVVVAVARNKKVIKNND